MSEARIDKNSEDNALNGKVGSIGSEGSSKWTFSKFNSTLHKNAV